jgi:choline dehydrogenase
LKCDRDYGYYKQGEGWRMLRNGLQFKLFGAGPILSVGVEARAFVNPTDRSGEPTIQAFCVPIVYLDRDTLDLLPNTYGLTVTTVVVKPKSRGFVRLASANPADMGLTQPNFRSRRRPHDDRRSALLPSGVPDHPAEGASPRDPHPRSRESQ